MTFSGRLRRHNAICSASQASCAVIRDDISTEADNGTRPQVDDDSQIQPAFISNASSDVTDHFWFGPLA